MTLKYKNGNPEIQMLAIIKQYFSERMNPADSPAGEKQAIHRATAVLMAEMMRMDGEIQETERKIMRSALYSHFGLSASEIDEILAMAEQEAETSHDYYQFTTLINSTFSIELKIEIIESLWRIAYADNQLDKYEEHLLRRISDLIYVPHRDFIAAKHRIQDEVGI